MKYIVAPLFMLICAVSAFAELPVLQVRPVQSGSQNPKRIQIYEILITIPDDMSSNLLCADFLAGYRKLPYRDGDTYEGSGAVELSTLKPKATIRFKADGTWRQLPPPPEAINSVPRFAPLPGKKEIKIGWLWLKGNETLQEIEVGLTLRSGSGEAKTITLKWSVDKA